MQMLLDAIYLIAIFVIVNLLLLIKMDLNPDNPDELDIQ